MPDMGRIGIIANPAAQSGAAASIAGKFADMLAKAVGSSNYTMLLTERAGHAIDIAAEHHDKYDTVIAIGGDGLVHEVANGLMRVQQKDRPKFAVVPVGSGNDYALTLGMSTRPEEALKQILKCDVQKMDVGRVNGEFFVETLSFGIDAAIALDTVERRKKSGRHGTILYMESGFDQIFHHLVPQNYSAELEGIPDSTEGILNISGQSYIFAVQIGKTYGGHFYICPDADPEDGLFDICIAHPPLNKLTAAMVFLKAKDGKHVGNKKFEFHKASSLVVDFDNPPACQADGERLEGSHFEIETIPQALDVIVGDYKG